ncbi:uncharacterized protein LY79DRAFT_575055 [Colletotrichum navitas]|uniref:Uncharacterized protein n=1 Tax=Colletotrichum navitas TaxID=681940 RepID=A0AAD8V9H9_9PEZI|nr:uncharacterized protein LY79DRAFT_575055 [Colletotrichum navitas]KAK1599327.1 hypothetical protein LY79DRAFT_575055 [Colletotrichum navitas]
MNEYGSNKIPQFQLCKPMGQEYASGSEENELRPFENIVPCPYARKKIFCTPAQVKRSQRSSYTCGPPPRNQVCPARVRLIITPETDTLRLQALRMGPTESYRYPGEKLELEDAFRLVEVQPGERDAPVAVHLLASNLHGCPQDEALSYAWGDATQTKIIHVVTFASCGDTSSTTPLSVTRSCDSQRSRGCYLR